MLKQLSIKGKMLAGFGCVLVTALIIAVVALTSMISSSNVENEIRSKILDEVNPLFLVHRNYNALHSWLHIIDVTPTKTQVQTGMQASRELQAVIDRLPSTTFPQNANAAKQALNSLVQAFTISGYQDKLNAGDWDGAHQIFINSIQAPLIESNKQLSQLIYSYVDYMQKQVTQLDLSSAIYLTIAITVVCIIMALFVASLMHHYIVGNINRLLEVARQIKQGNFKLEMIDNSRLHKDEIGKIYRAFEDIVKTLNRTIARTISISLELEKNSKELNTSAQAVNSGAQDSEQRAVTIAAAADEMVSTTSNIAKSCHTAQETSEDTRNYTNNGVSTVRAAVTRIKEQAEYTKEGAAKVLRLAEQSSKVSSIVSTIEDIAAQTNLLALNAAIEAARAGEAGRGFAVVADEVRALASRTSASTKEISSMVEGIQIDSEDATKSINQSVEQMQDVADQASALEDTLNTIRDSVNNVNSQIVQIATSAEEQINATSEISNNLQTISTVAQQATDVASNSSHIANYCENLVNGLLNELHFFTLDETLLDPKDLEFHRVDTDIHPTNASTPASASNATKA